MPIINITSLDHPGVEVFSSLTEAQLRSGRYTDKEIFIAESPKVIHVALNAGYRATALLCERRHIDGDAAAIISRIGDEVPATATCSHRSRAIRSRGECCAPWSVRLCPR